MRKKKFANEDKTVFNQRTASSSCPSTPFTNLPQLIQGCLLLPAFLPLCLSSPIFSLLAGPAALPADAAAAAAAAAGEADGVGQVCYLKVEMKVVSKILSNQFDIFSLAVIRIRTKILALLFNYPHPTIP